MAAVETNIHDNEAIVTTVVPIKDEVGHDNKALVMAAVEARVHYHEAIVTTAASSAVPQVDARSHRSILLDI